MSCYRPLGAIGGKDRLRAFRQGGHDQRQERGLQGVEAPARLGIFDAGESDRQHPPAMHDAGHDRGSPSGVRLIDEDRDQLLTWIVSPAPRPSTNLTSAGIMSCAVRRALLLSGQKCLSFRNRPSL